jgi:hypothetical protein
MSRPFSHSAGQKYDTCARMYDIHYNEKLRPEVTPAHLIFGQAVDAGLNAMLLGTGSPLDACDAELKRLVVEPVRFKRANYDGELIDDVTKAELLKAMQSFGYKGDDVDGQVAFMFTLDKLSAKQQQAVALACVTSFRALAALMFKAYERDVMPYISKVYAVQREEIIEHKGRKIVVKIDVDCELKGYGRTVLDNKTASRSYEPDAAETDLQLALYSALPEFTHKAFAVLPKRVKKNREKTCSVCGHVSRGQARKCDAGTPRCGGEWNVTIAPSLYAQLLVAPVCKDTSLAVMDDMRESIIKIEAGLFPQNLDACANQYGEPCPYFNYCHKQDKTGLKGGV